MKIGNVLVSGLLLAVLGCSKLTLENYNRIAVGMSYDEVVELIGAPKTCDDVLSVRSCTWGDETRSVKVNFLAGEVLLYSSANLD